jgi:uncharacterized protein (TIGR02145 family)
MRKLFTLLVAVLLTASVFAQSPEKMSYQAVIRDASDNLITDTQVGMQISILQGSASGTAVYVETQEPTTNANGLVSIEIGTGTVESGDFMTIDWANGTYFIKTETAVEAPLTTYTITGTSQLLSVPYALHAKTAETVSGGITETDPTFTTSQAANIDATDITNLGNLSGTNTGDQDLSSLATKTALGDSTALVRSEIPDVSGFLTSETDPTYTSSEAANITATDITNLGNLSGTNTGDQDLSTLATKTALGDSTAQVRSEIPDVSGFLTSETDPTYTSSEAANITATDITNLGNLSGTNTGDQDISGLATKTALADSTAQVRSEIPDVSGFLTSETDPSVPTGTQTGEMQYWNGSAWVTVAAGTTGQKLSNLNGVPTWIDSDALVDPVSGQIWKDVTSPTGEIWMDRNLGASQAATSSNDAAAYGDLYQWGRAADGHESRTSSTTSTNATTAVPNGGNSWDGRFITEGSPPNDWLTSQDNNLWQGISGTNNPCPSGYRLPTEAEWDAERESWGSNNSAGAFASPLKLPVAGGRDYSFGWLYDVGSYGDYWSSTVSGAFARYLYFGSSGAYLFSGGRADGFSVRCLKD